MANPILVTGAAGRIGAVGRTITEQLLKQGKAVRAMVRNEDERAQALRDMGAEVVIGNLLDLDSLHRAIDGCDTMYFGMSVSDDYLAATVNTAAVAKHHGVKAFINMSQMTLSQMSITETTASPQHKLQWLSEQALNWSGLPVVHVRPTVFLEGFLLIVTKDSVRESNQIRLPFGEGKTSPVAVDDVARVVATLLENPQPHIGKIYHLTGPQSENMHFYAQEYSKALGTGLLARMFVRSSSTRKPFTRRFIEIALTTSKSKDLTLIALLIALVKPCRLAKPWRTSGAKLFFVIHLPMSPSSWQAQRRQAGYFREGARNQREELSRFLR